MTPQDWVVRGRVRHDPMDPWAANALVATLELDRPTFGPGDALPPFWHWLYFLEAAPRSALGPDGHPAVGRFMPAVAQPRRMWAGGRVSFPAPLALGREARIDERISSVAEKRGRAGAMTVVTVGRRIASGQAEAVVEEQDILYRHDPPPGTPARALRAAPEGETHARDWVCDETVLFRYSALTFNGHRIHYDLRHARETESYPGLVVHGPLLATLLLELAGTIGGPPARFEFRATAPVFAGERFAACARADGPVAALWVRGADGRLAMTGEAGW